MVRKRQIMEFPPSTNYNSLVCVTTVRNMDPITLCSHMNLLIAVAIGSGLRFSGSTLNFHLLCLCFGPPVVPCIPHYGRGSSPDLGLNLGLFDYCTSHIFQKKTIFPVLLDRRRFGVNRKMLANPESQYNPCAPWRPFRWPTPLLQGIPAKSACQ